MRLIFSNHWKYPHNFNFIGSSEFNTGLGVGVAGYKIETV